MALLKLSDLKTFFHTRAGVVRAVNGVSFSIEKGETLGIVGESGSGKSVACYSLMGLIPKPPGKIESGQALFDGEDLLQMSEAQLNRIRGRRIAMIFQDPMTSLNPFLRIETQLIEPLLIHGQVEKAEAVKATLGGDIGHDGVPAACRVDGPSARKRVTRVNAQAKSLGRKTARGDARGEFFESRTV